MAHTHALVVRMPPTLVVDGIARGVDVGAGRIAIDGPPDAVPWIGDLEAIRQAGTWHHGRRARRVTVDIVPMDDRAALLTLTTEGRGVDAHVAVDLAERVRSRLMTGAPSASAQAAPAPVLVPVAVVIP